MRLVRRKDRARALSLGKMYGVFETGECEQFECSLHVFTIIHTSPVASLAVDNCQAASNEASYSLWLNLNIRFSAAMIAVIKDQLIAIHILEVCLQSKEACLPEDADYHRSAPTLN